MALLLLSDQNENECHGLLHCQPVNADKPENGCNLVCFIFVCCVLFIFMIYLQFVLSLNLVYGNWLSVLDSVFKFET